MKKIWVLCFLLLGLLLTACNQSKSSDSNPGVTPSATASPTIVETTPVRRVEKCSIVAQNQLPANWPDDIPYFKSALVTSVKCNPNESDNFEVRFSTSDSGADVFEYYQSEVVNETWKIISAVDAGPYATYSYYKVITASKTGRELIVDIRKGDSTGGKVEIIIRERFY